MALADAPRHALGAGAGQGQGQGQSEGPGQRQDQSKGQGQGSGRWLTFGLGRCLLVALGDVEAEHEAGNAAHRPSLVGQLRRVR